MSIAPESLLADNGGELESEMFDTLDQDGIRDRLEVYLADGVARATASDLTDDANLDAAATAWAYYRAYTQRSLQLANRETTFSATGGVNVSTTSDQRATVANRAAYWLETFTGYTVATVDAATGFAPPSGSSRTHIGWGGTRYRND